jgi:drug/metabolite transporter superfamily protein YnfA
MKSPLKYQLILALNTLSLIGFGIAFFVNPHSMTGQFGITLNGTDAIADVYAVYGGFEIGIGLFLAWCAWKSRALKEGLVAATFCLCGFFVGRLIGVISQGHPTESTYKLLATDALGAILNPAFLIMYLREKNQGTSANVTS